MLAGYNATPASKIGCHSRDLSVIDALANAVHDRALAGISAERLQRQDEILGRQVMDRGNRPLASAIRAVTGGTSVHEGWDHVP